MIWIPQPLTIAKLGVIWNIKISICQQRKKYVQLVKNSITLLFVQFICASGDKFIADETKKRTLNHDFKADICDMESVAIVLICDQNNIPNLILKTVSDSITGGAAEFRSSIEKAADICLEILDDILKEL